MTPSRACAQYKALAELQDKYKRKGFEVLAFPCNQFGSQEPGTPPDSGFDPCVLTLSLLGP